MNNSYNMDIIFTKESLMKYIVLILTLLTVGCVSTSTPPSVAKATVNGEYEILGAKIYSPNNAGWYLLQQSQYSVTFGMIPTTTDSAIANVTIFKIDGFEDDKSFLESIIATRSKVDDETRWKNSVLENQLVTFKGYSCFNYKTVAEDHKSKSKSKKTFQYFHTLGTTCRHPDYKDIAVQAEFSYRADSKAIPESIQTVADKFISTLELIK